MPKNNIVPTHVYIGRYDCGCCVAASVDLKDKTTAAQVAEFIESGLSIDRIDFAKYRNEVCKEETFMQCPHRPKKKEPEQIKMELV
jgi:hypothetical protein